MKLVGVALVILMTAVSIYIAHYVGEILDESVLKEELAFCFALGLKF
jgi:hypothetical protein